MGQVNPSLLLSLGIDWSTEAMAKTPTILAFALSAILAKASMVVPDLTKSSTIRTCSPFLIAVFERYRYFTVEGEYTAFCSMNSSTPRSLSARTTARLTLNSPATSAANGTPSTSMVTTLSTPTSPNSLKTTLAICIKSPTFETTLLMLYEPSWLTLTSSIIIFLSSFSLNVAMNFSDRAALGRTWPRTYLLRIGADNPRTAESSR